MKLTPLARQIQHFESRRELEGAEKKELTNPEDIRNWVDESFERTCAEDQGPKDFDPLPGRVFKTGKGRTLEAAFELTGQQRHLQRSEAKFPGAPPPEDTSDAGGDRSLLVLVASRLSPTVGVLPRRSARPQRSLLPASRAGGVVRSRRRSPTAGSGSLEGPGLAAGSPEP